MTDATAGIEWEGFWKVIVLWTMWYIRSLSKRKNIIMIKVIHWCQWDSQIDVRAINSTLTTENMLTVKHCLKMSG